MVIFFSGPQLSEPDDIAAISKDHLQNVVDPRVSDQEMETSQNPILNIIDR